MTLETETVLDRRRLRRHVSFWRALAIVGLAIALGVLLLGQERLSELAGRRQIARIAVEGTITENRDQLKMLKKLAETDQVEAVLVFVNSPGGTTTGGEALYEGLREIAKKKPVVAQFGTVAASAGYITGLGADYIVARGNSITGSIGVIVQWPEVTELLDKLGVKVNEVKSGDLKASPSPFEPLDEAGRKVTEAMVDDGFRWFLSLVETRRGIKASDVPGLERGRIFSGREALATNLVDQIGGEAEAVRWLVDKRKVTPDLKVVDWKPEVATTWGTPLGLGQVALSLIGEGGARFAKFVTQDGVLGLDGLVSVWHPSEN